MVPVAWVIYFDNEPTQNVHLNEQAAIDQLHMTERRELVALSPEAPNCKADNQVMVPRKPTSEMIQAMENRMVEGAGYIDRNSIQYALWVEVYRAMLDAAPDNK